jgi:hypothetical protein
LGWGNLRKTVNSKMSKPAGTSRNPAKNNGDVSGMMAFITTIAVPKKKNGVIKTSGDCESAPASCLACMTTNKPFA